MTNPSPVPRLTDIIEAAALINTELAGVTLQTYENDRRKQWIVERGVEIVSEASRHLPVELKERHPDIPWTKVAGIGNVLRHNYENVSLPLIWTLTQEYLPALEKVCKEELVVAIARQQERKV